MEVKRRVLFVSRYTFRDVDGSINYSVNRKVKGILSLFKGLNFEPWILKTADFSHYRGPLRSTYSDSNIGIINKNFGFVIFPRILNYFISILINSFTLRRIEDKFDYIIFWDFLPDTFLPILLSGVDRKKVIGDIEEFISCDPEAGWIFKKFELFFINRYKLKKYFVSNKSIVIADNVETFTVNGFFAENVVEESYCRSELMNYQRTKRIRIFFSSRFDENRGIDLVLELIELDRTNRFFDFIICGFGSEKYLERLTSLMLPNVHIKYEVDRRSLLSLLINSEISLNILKNAEFSISSFPSKLIEYTCLGGLIVSNVVYDEIIDNCIKVDLNSNDIYSKLIEVSKTKRVERNLDRNLEEMQKYGIMSKAMNLKCFLNN